MISPVRLHLWHEYLKWISVGMTPVLLFGMYRWCERQMVISHQIQLINTFRHKMYETQRSTDQYVANIEVYCELKAIDDSWFYSLTAQQKQHMHLLRDYLGVSEIPDVSIATTIVRQVSAQTLKVLSANLEVLEDALSNMDVEKMRELQDVMNKMQLSTFSKMQMEHIKSEIISTSRELQARGTLSRIFSTFYDFLVAIISKVAVPLAYKLLENIIL